MQFGTKSDMMHVSNYNAIKANGFSLLEAVVVIAVLSILVAISLPLFFSMVDTAAARAAQHSLMNLYKECQIQKLSGNSNSQFGQGKIQGYIFSAVPSNAEVFDFANLADLPGIPQRTKCIDEFTGELNNFIAINDEPLKFPRFFIYSVNINKYCQTGDFSQHPNTYEIGCKGILGAGDKVSKSNLIGFWN